MKGEGWSRSRCSAACSRRTLGANGRKASRFLTSRFRRSRMSGSRGSASRLRAPSARGPISMRAVEPADHLAAGQAVDDGLQQIRLPAPEVGGLQSGRGEQPGDLVRAPARAEVGVPLRLQSRPLAGLFQVGERGGAQAAARVAGRRLHEQPLERAFPQDARVRHAVERHAAGHAEVPGAGALVQPAGLLQQDLLEHAWRLRATSWWKAVISDSRCRGGAPRSSLQGVRVHPACRGRNRSSGGRARTARRGRRRTSWRSASR